MTENNTSTTKKSSFKRKLIFIIPLTISFLALLGLCITVYAYLRLNSIHDPSVEIVERSGVYSAPTEYSGEPADVSGDVSYFDDFPITDPGTDVSAPEGETSKAPGGNNGGSGDCVLRPKNVPIYKTAPINEDILNILILGVDSTDATKSGGRSDTMIVASYNKKTGVVNLISLLRDSFVPIEDHNWNRLNTGYFFGGVGLCINTINDVFLLDIQSYIMVDFNSLPKLIDKIGGIEVELTKAEADYYNKHYNWSLTEGKVVLNGSQALAHARNRSVGNADFARTHRQRDLLMRIINKMLDKNDLVGTISMINSSLDLIKTNMRPETLVNLATSVYSGPKLKLVPMRMTVDNSYEPFWYRPNMLVTKIDIVKNREALRKAIYGD